MTEKLNKVGVEIHDSVDFLQEYLSAPQPLCQRKVNSIKSEKEDVDEKALCLQSGATNAVEAGYIDPYDAIPPSKEAQDPDEIQFKGLGNEEWGQ